MGGGELIKKGWLVKSPPLETSGMKVSIVIETFQWQLVSDHTNNTVEYDSSSKL